MIRGFDLLTNRKARVFISSTFLDMGPERNAIVHRIFPALRKHFAAKKIDIVEIDLRWGILDEEIVDGTLIEVCISEVRRCAPFFLGIIGNNYGSVPSDDDVDSTNDSILNMISDDVPYGISITEMEMRAGILKRKHQQASVLVKKVQKEDRLNNLIDALQASNKCDVLEYEDIDDFADKVFLSMKTHIEKVFFANLPQVYGDERYYDHLNYLKIHLEHYVENTTTVSSLESIVEDSNYCYVQGASGIGKSAFLSYLIKHYDEISPNSPIFFHFPQADMNEEIDGVWKRLSSFLTDRGIMQPADTDDLIQETKEALLLYDNVYAPLYIFIDDIDKFNGNKNYAFELQSLASDSVKIILTGTKTAPSGTPGISLRPLLKAQIPQLFVKWFAQYDKKFDTSFLPKLEDNLVFRNPLVLSFALNELRTMGVHNGLHEYLNALLSCDSESDVFSEAVNCTVNVIGDKALLTNCLAVLYLCKNGMGESDIIEILNLSHVTWVTIYGLMQGFFYEVDGDIKYRNEKLANAVFEALNLTAERERELRTLLFEYWLKDKASDRARRELPWQAYHLKNADYLSEHFSNYDNLVWSYTNDTSALSRYLQFLHSNDRFIDVISLSKDFLRDKKIAQLFEILLWTRCYNEIPDLFDAVSKDYALGLFEKKCNARALFKQAKDKYLPAKRAFEKILSEYPTVDEEINEIKFLYGITLCEAGEFEASYRIIEEVIAYNDANKIVSFYSSYAMAYLANNQYTYGELKNALASVKKAMLLREELYGTDSIEAAWVYCFAIPILYANGNTKEAMEKAKAAIRIYSRYFGDAGVEYAWSASIAANCHLLNNEPLDAIRLYESSIEQNDNVIDEASRPHPYSLTAYNALAVTEWLYGNKANAIEKIKQVIDWKKERLQADHCFTGNSVVNLAVMVGETDPHAGLLLLDEADRIFAKSFAADHPDRQYIDLCRIVFLRASKKEKEAEVLIKKLGSAPLESHQIASIYSDLHSGTETYDRNCYWTSDNLCELLLIPKVK